MALLSLQTEYDAKNAVDLNFMVKPPFASPWRLESILWERAAGLVNIDIIVQVVYQGDIFVLDTLTATTATSYVFPNARVPHPIALGDKHIVIFKTVGMGPCKTSVLINWSQVGAM